MPKVGNEAKLIIDLAKEKMADFVDDKSTHYEAGSEALKRQTARNQGYKAGVSQFNQVLGDIVRGLERTRKA